MKSYCKSLECLLPIGNSKELFGLLDSLFTNRTAGLHTKRYIHQYGNEFKCQHVPQDT